MIFVTTITNDIAAKSVPNDLITIQMWDIKVIHVCVLNPLHWMESKSIELETNEAGVGRKEKKLNLCKCLLWAVAWLWFCANLYPFKGQRQTNCAWKSALNWQSIAVATLHWVSRLTIETMSSEMEHIFRDYQRGRSKIDFVFKNVNNNKIKLNKVVHHDKKCFCQRWQIWYKAKQRFDFKDMFPTKRYNSMYVTKIWFKRPSQKYNFLFVFVVSPAPTSQTLGKRTCADLLV